MNLYYPHLENNHLLLTLEENIFYKQVLFYHLTFKIYTTFRVIPHKHSIEICSYTIRVFIILYVGFEQNEYLQFENLPDVHFVCLDRSIQVMYEFKDILSRVKFLPPYVLFFTALDIAPDDTPIGTLKFLLHKY